MQPKANLEKMSTWAGILGYFFVGLSIVEPIIGILSSEITAIFGVGYIFPGIILIKVQKTAQQMLNGDFEENLDKLFSRLAFLFKVVGIFSLVSMIILPLAFTLIIVLTLSRF